MLEKTIKKNWENKMKQVTQTQQITLKISDI